jgi:hypothetical protein
MNRRTEQMLSLAAILVLSVLSVQAAENVDPLNDGSQYAYGENVGWINAEPGGDGADGLIVEDFRLGGWMWGENIGWISLSCETTDSCDRMPYGIRNDGLGNLSGEAWAENAGWIIFDPEGDGRVIVDVFDGTFYGQAWGENVGWITMSSLGGPNPYAVRTGWNCAAPPPPPTDPPFTFVAKGSPTEAELLWDPIPGASGYDVTVGWIDVLRTHPAGFEAAIIECSAENTTTTSAYFPQVPPSGQGYWYLVRGVNCGDSGSYDSGGLGQVVSRDVPILSSGVDCAIP